MKFTAVGDILPQKKIFHDYQGFDRIKAFIEQGEARFFNLETTLNRAGECFASQFSGGTYIRNDPDTFYGILNFGFNMTSANNNHAFDFSYRGFAETLKTLRESGVTHSGIGENLHEAAAPAYRDTKHGRVALISVCTAVHPSMMAGVQSKRTPGRPGINGLRVSCEIVLPPDAFRMAQTIGEKSGINAEKIIDRIEGYDPPLPESVCEVGDQLFICGERYGLRWKMDPADLSRIEASIREAAMRADYVMVSVHTHQIAGEKKETNPPFMEEFAHLCVDWGADAIVGHGPHLLRPIEVYRDRPIFYSLGDFLMQLYDVPYAPEEFYAKFGMTSEQGVMDLLKKRSDGFRRGLMETDAALETVIPFWETDGKKLKSLQLMPIRISRREGMQLEGLPRPATDTAFMEHLAEISAPYGTTVEMKNGIAVCKWKK